MNRYRNSLQPDPSPAPDSLAVKDDSTITVYRALSPIGLFSNGLLDSRCRTRFYNLLHHDRQSIATFGVQPRETVPKEQTRRVVDTFSVRISPDPAFVLNTVSKTVISQVNRLKCLPLTLHRSHPRYLSPLWSANTVPIRAWSKSCGVRTSCLCLYVCV